VVSACLVLHCFTVHYCTFIFVHSQTCIFSCWFTTYEHYTLLLSQWNSADLTACFALQPRFCACYISIKVQYTHKAICTAMNKEIAVFLDVVQSNLVEGYQHSTRICCLLLFPSLILLYPNFPVQVAFVPWRWREQVPPKVGHFLS
jgi:hypothetical protein